MNTLFKPATRTRFRIPHFKLATAFCILTFVGFASDANAAPRERTLIDSGWRFQLGDPPDVLTNAAETNVTYYPEIPDLAKLQSSEVSGTTSETYMETLRADPVATHMGENVSVVKTNFNDSSWRSLNLPHDWAVELPFNSSADINHGYKPVGTGFSANSVGWYRRTFTLPANYAGQSLWLEFDGVYRNCLVWLNGHILGRNVGGYGSFYFDASQYANPGGTNVLVVRVDANRFEGWFYEGAGIYRHVWLTKTSPLHIEHWGTFVTNKITGGNALVTVRTTLDNSNASPANCTLTSTILDAQSNTVVSAVQGITIPAGTNQIVAQTVTITNAHLWSLNSPYLYQLVSTVTQAGVTNDVYQTPFGARTILLDATNGLFLNGQRVEIQGACNHQDHAGVGSAIPDRLQDFRIEKLKEMGCNALRTSHNPPNPELLDECDRIGMLVLDENRRLGTNAEPLVELQRLVLRDRNHPCIFAWSLANEEPLQGWTPLGATIIQVMQNLAHQLDPTRLCTVAMNGNWGSGFSTVIDVQGFNYENNGNENSFHSSHPTIPAFATEEASTLTTRGIYADTSSYEQAYDVDIPSWGATAETWWTDYVAREPWNGGAFIWTGFDYRGEPTPFSWPDISSEFGSMDTCGFPKDNYYYYQANWSGKTVLHLLPHWNWSSGSISVWCFCNCDSVELFLNGASQGLQQVNVLGHAQWSVTYAAGTLSAVGYRDGRAIITNSVSTTGSAAAVSLVPDRKTILADGRDVSVVTVAVTDAQGRVVPTAANTVSFTITGGAIIGVGNGNPTSHEVDKATNNVWQRMVFNGLAQVIVQSTNQAGSIVLTATSSGLASTNITITAAAAPPLPAAPANLAGATGNTLAVAWLTWDGVPAATTYNVKRSTSSGGPYTTVASQTYSYFTDSGLINGATYYYVVSAVNAVGESANSVQVSVTINGSGFTSPIVLVNPGFETNTSGVVFTSKVSTGFDVSGNDVAGWLNAGSTYASSGVDYAGDSGVVVHGGSVTAYCDQGDSGAYQITGYPMQAGDQLTLTWWAKSSYNNAAQSVSLLSGASPGSAFGSLTTLATSTAALNNTGNGGAYTQYTLTYTAGAADAGKYVAVSFLAPGTAGSWAMFDDFALSVTSTSQLPSPWASGDIGAVGVAGSATYTNGLFTVKGSGADIWGTGDTFNYAYQPASGDCSIQAEVLSVQNTQSHAKGGVMIRETLNTNSAMAMVDLTPSAGVEFVWRTNTAASAASVGVAGITAPNWVKVTRTGNSFVGYYSTNGTAWTVLGTNTITMGTGVYVGLPVCAHNNTVTCTATFTNVVATP